MKRIRLLLAAIAAMVGLSASAQSWTAPTLQGEDPVSGTAYKIYNVGAEKFLSGGKAWFSWSTTAVLTSTPLEETFTGNASSFTLKRSDGKFVFTSGNDIQGDAMHVDGASATNYGLTKLPNGHYRIHDAGGDGSSCWGYNSTFHASGIVAHANPEAEGWNCEWIFLTDQSYLLYNARLTLYTWYLDATDNGVSADAYKNVYDNSSATVDELNAASASLKQDILEALVAAGNYPVDVTKYTLKNPDFTGTYEGWTKVTPYGGNCALKDGVAMEYWAGNASDRAKASFNIYQELDGLPAGVYTVSADMYNSLNSEGGDYTTFSPTCGLYGLSSNEEVALVEEDGTTLKTYTTGEVLVFRGKMTIGVKNTVTPIAARWFLFDNVKLTYARQLTAEEIAANTAPESVELDRTSVDMTIYGTTTLVPTVLPEEAGDKTVSWTTSNDKVATVNNGVITAVGIGTATITAIANGADNVSTTATITVNDVEAVTAPAFYSEIAAGDFYIMNAATGKFLGGANSWGTQASLIDHGIPFTAALGNGVYTLDSHTYNNTTDHFFSGTYVDGSATNLYITSVGDGKYTISTADGSAYVTAKPGTTVIDNSATNGNSALSQWYFISKSDRDKTLAAATAENPVDATYYIKEANIGRNLRVAFNTSGWTGDKAYGGNNENQCAERYKATTNVYQVINVPNGTYKVKVQGFYRQEEGDAISYFYANDEETALTQIFPGGINSMSGASTAFSNGEYTTELEVTVTNRTLKVGVKCDAATNWTIFDNFELYLKSYAPVTAIAAELDKEEIQIGQTAQITATTTPVNASFNAVTSYSSSDEDVATVDANGVVTGVAVGTATITIVANEMENNSTTVDVTVTLVKPTAIELSESEVTLDKENPSVTLTVTATPDGANDAVNWSSSDESVATVENGVVTAITSGTATITATSVVDENVKGTATITVDFPETEVAEYINNGATRYILGENLIKNGAFEYPNNFYGWTTGSNKAMSADNFNLITDGENHYIKAKGHSGAGGDNSIGTGWAIEAGKTYVFGYKVKGTSAGNSEYHVVSLTNTLGTESQQISKKETAVGTDWTDVHYTFTNPAENGFAYVQFRARWLNSAVSFDDFYLTEVTNVVGNTQYAQDAIPTENIGGGAFQYATETIVATGINTLVQGTSTPEEVQAVYDALQTMELNKPIEGQRFNIVMGELTWTNNNNATMLATQGKAVTFYKGGRNDAGLYSAQFDKEPNANYAQAFIFTPADGLNKYTISQIDVDGEQRYICTGEVYSGNANQVRTTTTAEDAEVYTIKPSAKGVYTITNSSSINLGAQDAGLYGTTRNNNLLLVEAEKANVEGSLAAGKLATRIFPFTPKAIDGIKYYAINETHQYGNETHVSPVEVEELAANTPYILYNTTEDPIDITQSGFGTATKDVYSAGALTGVYTDSEIAADAGNYILQTQNDVQAFYLVSGSARTATPYRAYLTAPGAGARIAISFDNETTGINGVNATEKKFDGTVYDLSGRKIENPTRGLYIVNGKKVVIK